MTFLCFSQSDFVKKKNFHVKKKKTLREAKLTTPNITRIGWNYVLADYNLEEDAILEPDVELNQPTSPKSDQYPIHILSHLLE